MLRTVGLSKRYADHWVVDGCDIELAAGEIHALLGANGAGKSTLVRMIAGLVRPTAGTILLDDREIECRSKKEAEALGIEIVQQELNLVPTLSVAENLFLNRLPHRGGILRTATLRKNAIRALERVKLETIDPRLPLSKLGVGRQQMVEIASALDRHCRVLILDEPTAALSDSETQTLFDNLRRLRRDGLAIVYITHRLDEILSLGDRVTVLRDGRCLRTESTSGLDQPTLIRWMNADDAEPDSSPCSRPASSASDRSRHEADEVTRGEFSTFEASEIRLRVDDLSGGPVRNASLSVRRGECLGIGGLVGSGRTELLRLIFGADVAKQGSITIDTHSRRPFRSPAEAVRNGLAMVTEDRKQNGLLLPASILRNMTLPTLRQKFSRFGLPLGGREKEGTHHIVDRMSVRCVSPSQPIRQLSGGNQQKVACGKWLLSTSDVFLLDEPTRGIDVAARERIYEMIRQLRMNGAAVVMVSSDYEELLANCNAIAVMHEGRLGPARPIDHWDRGRLLDASFGREEQSTQETATSC